MAEARSVKIEFTQWDELPDPTFTVKRDGTAVDLSGGTLKIYIKRNDSSTLVADGVAAIDWDAVNGTGDGTDGKIVWDVSDTPTLTDEAGDYTGHIVVTTSSADETILTELDIAVRRAIKGADV